MERELIYVITSDDNDDMTATTDPQRAFEILNKNKDCYVSLVDDEVKYGKVHYSDFINLLFGNKMDAFTSNCILNSFNLILQQFED